MYNLGSLVWGYFDEILGEVGHRLGKKRFRWRFGFFLILDDPGFFTVWSMGVHITLAEFEEFSTSTVNVGCFGRALGVLLMDIIFVLDVLSGNWLGKKAFTKGPACSKCGDGAGWCNNGLCNRTSSPLTCLSILFYMLRLKADVNLVLENLSTMLCDSLLGARTLFLCSQTYFTPRSSPPKRYWSYWISISTYYQ